MAVGGAPRRARRTSLVTVPFVRAPVGADHGQDPRAGCSLLAARGSRLATPACRDAGSGTIGIPSWAGVVKLADARDSKSRDLRVVWVQFPPPAHHPNQQLGRGTDAGAQGDWRRRPRFGSAIAVGKRRGQPSVLMPRKTNHPQRQLRRRGLASRTCGRRNDATVFHQRRMRHQPSLGLRQGSR